MSSKIEKKENNIVTLTFVVPNERFEEGLNHSYNINKGRVNVPGFRKGKAPRSFIEKAYGREFFMEDAIDFVFPEAYEKAVEENSLEPVSRPEIADIDVDGNEEGVVFTALVTVKPEVDLGEYKGLSYNDYPVVVEDAEVSEEILKAREKNARIITISDRPIENGDTVTIDFEGFTEGVAFEGGKGEDYKLEIGSHTFIDTFEEQLIGKNIGDSSEISVTFPEDYGQETLAGKAAVFKVDIKEINKKELPEEDDEFAQDVSEFDTFDEYKASVKDKLKAQKEHKKEHDIEEELIGKASENATIDIPAVMVNKQIEQMIMEFENRLRSQGLDLNTFFSFSGQSPEDFVESHRERAEKNVRARLVLEEIAKREEIAPTEEDINKEIARIADSYGIEEEKMREIIREGDKKGLETDLMVQKALNIIVESAVAQTAAD